MPVTETAPLEFRHGALKRPVAIVLATLCAAELRGAAKNFVDMLGVVGPVGGDVDGATGSETVGAQVEKRWLYDAAFVVPFLWPGVREVKVDTRKARGWNLPRKNFDGVMDDQLQVRHPGGVCGNQAVSNARLMPSRFSARRRLSPDFHVDCPAMSPRRPAPGWPR